MKVVAEKNPQQLKLFDDPAEHKTIMMEFMMAWGKLEARQRVSN